MWGFGVLTIPFTLSAVVKNLSITFESPKIVLFPGILQRLVPRTPLGTKPTGVEVPYIKCMEQYVQSSFRIHGSQPWIKDKENWLYKFIEKILHISGSVQFTPMLFKGQLYIHIPLRTEKIKYKLYSTHCLINHSTIEF